MKNSVFTYKNNQPGLGFTEAAATNNTPSGGNTGVDMGTVINKSVNVIRDVTNLVGGGGNNESQADKSKQAIQKELKSMGYPQYSKMKGWGGDEAAKANAMRVILQAIQQYPDAGYTITNWLDGGKITPQTITRIQQNYNLSSSGSNKSMITASMGTINPLWVIGGAAGAGLLLIIATRKKKE